MSVKRLTTQPHGQSKALIPPATQFITLVWVQVLLFNNSTYVTVQGNVSKNKVGEIHLSSYYQVHL